MPTNYPHRCVGVPSDGSEFYAWTCRCGERPDMYSAEVAVNGWGFDCPAALRERIAEVEAERDAARDEATRLRDLVRHQRGPLHDAELITDAEYAALASDAGAVARLRGYDEVRREMDALRALGASIHKAVAAALEVRAVELDVAADTLDDYAESHEDRVRAESLRLAAHIVRST